MWDCEPLTLWVIAGSGIRYTGSSTFWVKNSSKLVLLSDYALMSGFAESRHSLTYSMGFIVSTLNPYANFFVHLPSSVVICLHAHVRRYAKSVEMVE